MTSETNQVDFDRLTGHLEEWIPGFQGPVTAEKFAGGQSNPTFLLKAQSGSYVLRRQPPGELLKSAHAVDREFRVLSALGEHRVPVARAYHLCEDRDVIGSLFYVMSYEDGRIFWNPALPEVPRGARRVLRRDSRHDGGAARRGYRGGGACRTTAARATISHVKSVWTKQYRAAQTDRLEAMESLIEWLPAHCPAEAGKPSLVHGDFRIDNLIFDQHAAAFGRCSTGSYPRSAIHWLISRTSACVCGFRRTVHIAGLAG